MKFILILAAVLTGDPANTDPSLEVLTKLFNTRACDGQPRPALSPPHALQTTPKPAQALQGPVPHPELARAP